MAFLNSVSCLLAMHVKGEALAKARPAFLEAVASIMTAAAADVGGKVGGITSPKS